MVGFATPWVNATLLTVDGWCRDTVCDSIYNLFCERSPHLGFVCVAIVAIVATPTTKWPTTNGMSFAVMECVNQTLPPTMIYQPGKVRVA